MSLILSIAEVKVHLFDKIQVEFFDYLPSKNRKNNLSDSKINHILSQLK